MQESIKINSKNLQIFIMKPSKISNDQAHLFKNRLSNQINMRHELVILSKVINWDALEAEIGSLHEDTVKGGQPPKPVRLMVGLLLLEYLKNLSDEEVVRSWVENPYWQYFCGYDFLQLEMPIDSSSLTRWRNRLGPEKLEKILGMSVKAAVDTGVIKQEELKTVIIDTTVMPKNIAFPTDTKLLDKSRKRIIKLASENEIELRQNYNRITKDLLRQIGGYLHAKQMKRAKKAQKKLKTIVGRVVRDCERKIAGNVNLELLFQNELKNAHHLLTRKMTDKNKLYSLHEESVECIAKGKAHKRYEFGCKVSLSITHKGKGVVTSSHALHGNPFDGHTLKAAIDKSAKITGIAVSKAFVDKGYKGHGVEGAQVFINGQRKGITKIIKKQMKRRQAIEPHIGHMKNEGKLGLCRLKGVAGDEIHAILVGAAYNIRLVLNHLRAILVQILLMITWIKINIEKNREGRNGAAA